MPKISEVVGFINKVRDMFPPQVDVSFVGRNGKCYQLALLLRHTYQEAMIYYDPVEGHVYTRIGNVYYDIEGAHYRVPPATSLLDHQRGHKPHRWHKSFGSHPVEYWLRRDNA